MTCSNTKTRNRTSISRESLPRFAKDGLNYKQKVSKQKCTVNTAKICERMFGGRGLNAKDLTITLLNTKPRDWTNFYRDSLPRFARRWPCL